MREADAIATEVENLNLRNQAMQVQQTLSSTRQEVSALEADLSMAQAESRLQASRIPQLRQQVEVARQERMKLENTAAALASELVAIQHDESPTQQSPISGAEAHRNIIERHASRLEESRRLASVREMRDTLANSALEAVLVDEIADVEREIREMHGQRTKLAAQLQGLVAQRTELSGEIERQVGELGLMSSEVSQMEKKRDEMGALSQLSALPSQNLGTSSMTEEISLLDSTIAQIQHNSADYEDQGDKDYAASMLGVLQSRREHLFVNLPKDQAANDEAYVQELERKLSEQSRQLEELRRAVGSP